VVCEQPKTELKWSDHAGVETESARWAQDLAFFDERIEEGLVAKLQGIVTSEFGAPCRRRMCSGMAHLIDCL
jgi:hypothetical protein